MITTIIIATHLASGRFAFCVTFPAQADCRLRSSATTGSTPRLFPATDCRAEPKSINTGLPSSRMTILPGLISRCRKSASCTASNPSSMGNSIAFNSEGEYRFLGMGRASSGRLLVVSYTEREENRIRIINARLATVAEKKRYESEN